MWDLREERIHQNRCGPIRATLPRVNVAAPSEPPFPRVKSAPPAAMVGSAAVGCAAAVGFTAALLAEGAHKAYRLRLHVPAEPTREADIEAAGHWFVRLPDGRKLEYSVTGRDDGVPVYLQHGYMGSCFMAPCIDRLMKELGVKLIAASMPGLNK